MSTLSPAMGATCGRREREAGAGNGRSNPFHVPTLAAVEGILVHATSSTFAGRRSNVSLGRSDSCALGLVPMQAVAPMTTGALWKKEEGNVVSMREAHALGTRVRGLISIDALSRTRPSLGPETRARQSALNSRWATTPRCRDSRGIAVGKTCASRKNRHRGQDWTDVARLAACHRSASNRGGRA